MDNGELGTVTNFTNCITSPISFNMLKWFKFKWSGHLFTTDELRLAENLTWTTNAGGTKKVGRPLVRWMDSAEEDHKRSGVNNWKTNGNKKNGVEKRSWSCEGWNQDVAPIRRWVINIKILYLCRFFLSAISQRCGYVLTHIFPLCNVLPEDGYSQHTKYVGVTVLYVITGTVCW